MSGLPPEDEAYQLYYTYLDNVKDAKTKGEITKYTDYALLCVPPRSSLLGNLLERRVKSSEPTPPAQIILKGPNGSTVQLPEMPMTEGGKEIVADPGLTLGV